MKTSKELKDELVVKRNRIAELNDKAKTENRDLTEAEGTEVDGLFTDIEALDVQVRRAEKLEQEALRRSAQNPATGVAGNVHTSDKEQRDLSKFSLGKLINQRMNGVTVDGIEAEVIKEGMNEASQRGVTPKSNIVLPYELFAVNKEGRDLVRERVEYRREHRDMTATGGTGGDQGGATITTSIGRLYEALFARIVLQVMGATFMPNLIGNVDLPRVVKGSAPTFKAENAAADEVSPTIAKSSLTPHRLPAFIEVSNQLLRQSEANISQVVQKYLVNELSSLFDKMGIQGSGSSNQPTGILNTSGIGAAFAGGAAASGTNANGAAPVWADFPNLYKEIAVDNADFGSLGYLVNPQLVAKLQTTAKASNTAVFIMPEGAQTINGFRAGVTNNVPSNLSKGTADSTLSAAIFGNFQDLWMGTWGGIELSINPYSKDTEGLTRINATMYGDVAVARPESFAAIKDFIA